MSPLLTPEVHTLVIVLPRGTPPNPPVMCWGIVVEKTAGGLFKIRVGSNEYDETYAVPEQVIPFLHTDGSFKDPQRVFAENEERITLELLLNFLSQQGAIPTNKSGPASLPEPGSLIPIQENTLVIVLPKDGANPPAPCWGLVCQRLTGGNYEVQTGRFRRLRLSRTIVQPDQLVPVYLTDGSFNSPRHAVRQLRSQLFLHLLLMFYSNEGLNFLRQISGPLSKSDFVLVSRKGKTPPSPTKKPE